MQEYSKHEGLVHWVVNRLMFEYNLKEHERDDLLQEGRIALLKAIDTYSKRDDLKEYKFSTIAYKQLRSKLVNFCNRNYAKHRGVVSLNTLVGEEEDTELQDLIECEEDTYRTVEQKIESHRIRTELSRLTTDEELQLLYRHYAFKQTLKTLGETKGVSGIDIRQQLDEIIKRIRKSKWYWQEQRARHDDYTSFVKANSLEYRAEKRYKKKQFHSPVESLVIDREERMRRFFQGIDDIGKSKGGNNIEQKK